MYTPKHFKINDRKEIFDFINANSFAILVSSNDGKLNATHIPLLLKSDEGENGFLYGHIAKANYQWENIAEDVLAIFHGPHKYISSSWYENSQTVPTWNYVAVHVQGKIKILDDRDSKAKIVSEIVNYFEGDDSKYKLAELSLQSFENLLKGIVAFKIVITGLEGKQKLSQNHPADRQLKVINRLEKNTDEDSIEIVKRMKKNLNQNKGNG